MHEILFYGNGVYVWGFIYNMPIWLRNFTFNQINNSYVKKNKDKDKKINENVKYKK